MMRFGDHSGETRTTIPFPVEGVRPSKDSNHAPEYFIQSADELLSALDGMSRRIDDLARELHCLGHFADDDDDRPRAA